MTIFTLKNNKYGRNSIKRSWKILLGYGSWCKWSIFFKFSIKIIIIFCIFLQQDVRVDGRSRSDYRQGDINLNEVTNSHGSIRVRLGETDVIVATKVDLGIPDPERPDQGTIKFLVDW